MLDERGLEAPDLARLLGTDARNPQRWLKGQHGIKGPTESAIRMKLAKIRKKRRKS